MIIILRYLFSLLLILSLLSAVADVKVYCEIERHDAERDESYSVYSADAVVGFPEVRNESCWLAVYFILVI